MSETRWTEEDVETAKFWMLRNADHARRSAAAYADDAKSAEAIAPVAAKRMAEAAHHFSVAAACLDGSRTFATEAELAETRAKYGAGEGVDRG